MFMATTAPTADLPVEVLANKGRVKGRKALKQKNDVNIPVENLPTESLNPSSPAEADSQKENHETLFQPRSRKKAAGKLKSKSKQAASTATTTAALNASSLPSFEKELQEMQEMMEKLKIEKEKAEGLLKEKDEMLRVKEEELKTKGKEQEKLQTELKKLQKVKGFNPTVDLPMFQSLAEKDLDNKEKKKKVCPERKRPATAYQLWAKEQWSEVKKTNPDADFKVISNILGAKWKTLGPEEKKPYEDKYQADKAAYLQAVGKEKRENEAMKLLEEEQKHKTAIELLDQYLLFKQEAEKNDTKKTKKEKDPLKPKQPMSAFFLFTNERRADLLQGGKNLLEVSKVMGEEWKNMTEEQKKPYEEKAKVNKEKYLQEMDLYKQKKEEEAASQMREEEEQMKIQKQEALQLLKKKEKTENIIKQAKDKKKKKKQKEDKNVDTNKPKRPLSSFFMFSKEARKNLLEERPGINNSTLTALVSLNWKELSDEEKSVWNKKAADAMEAYKKEMEQYSKNIAEPSK